MGTLLLSWRYGGHRPISPHLWEVKSRNWESPPSPQPSQSLPREGRTRCFPSLSISLRQELHPPKWVGEAGGLTDLRLTPAPTPFVNTDWKWEGKGQTHLPPVSVIYPSTRLNTAAPAGRDTFGQAPVLPTSPELQPSPYPLSESAPIVTLGRLSARISFQAPSHAHVVEGTCSLSVRGECAPSQLLPSAT